MKTIIAHNIARAAGLKLFDELRKQHPMLTFDWTITPNELTIVILLVEPPKNRMSKSRFEAVKTTIGYFIRGYLFAISNS